MTSHLRDLAQLREQIEKLRGTGAILSMADNERVYNEALDAVLALLAAATEEEARLKKREKAHGQIVETLKCEKCGEFGVVPDYVRRGFVCLDCGALQEPYRIDEGLPQEESVGHLARRLEATAFCYDHEKGEVAFSEAGIEILRGLYGK